MNQNVCRIALWSMRQVQWANLKYNNDVSWFHSWHLVSFSMEGDSLFVLHTLIHMHFQQLSLGGHLAASARPTPITFINHLTWKMADINSQDFSGMLYLSFDLMFQWYMSACPHIVSIRDIFQENVHWYKIPFTGNIIYIQMRGSTTLSSAQNIKIASYLSQPYTIHGIDRCQNKLANAEMTKQI